MATTNAAFLAGLVGLSSAAFAAAAAPPPENASLTAQPASAACTVRFNRYDDGAPIDERYINTPSAESTKYKGFTHSGITYDQPTHLKGTDPAHIDVSFQAEAGLHNWYMPNGEYHESDSTWAAGETYIGSLLGVEGVLYDSKYTNWTQSVEVEIYDPEKCISVKQELEKPLPSFNPLNHLIDERLPGADSNEYAKNVWSKTGFTTNFEDLKHADGVTLIDRDTRLDQDHASGQLKSDYSTLPPAWKP